MTGVHYTVNQVRADMYQQTDHSALELSALMCSTYERQALVFCKISRSCIRLTGDVTCVTSTTQHTDTEAATMSI